MQLTINGKEQRLDHQSLTVVELLKAMNVERPEMVSVEVNGNFVEREEFPTRQVQDGDSVEFLYFMGGGAI